jgi:hypothetical protein
MEIIKSRFVTTPMSLTSLIAWKNPRIDAELVLQWVIYGKKRSKYSLNNDNRTNKSDNSSDKPNPQNKSREDVGNSVRLGILNLPDPARLAVR